MLVIMKSKIKFLVLFICIFVNYGFAADFEKLPDSWPEFIKSLINKIDRLGVEVEGKCQEGRWAVQNNYIKEITKSSVIFVHPYTLCDHLNFSGTCGPIKKNFLVKQNEVNRLLRAAQELEFDIFVMAGEPDTEGVNADHFPVQPTACLYSRPNEVYAPLCAKIRSPNFVIIGGYFEYCITVSFLKIIDSYFANEDDSDEKSIHIYCHCEGMVFATLDNPPYEWLEDKIVSSCQIRTLAFNKVLLEKIQLFVHSKTNIEPKSYGEQSKYKVHVYLDK
jgi:hypothetical protein